MGLFESFILREAGESADKKPFRMAGGEEQVPMRQNTPDFTQSQSQQQQEPPPDAAGAPPQQDPGAAEDPNAAQGGEEQPPAEDSGEGDAPPEDPNAMDGEEMGPQNAEEELQQDEKEVFADLKPEQMAIKVKELKDQYSTLHQIIMDNLDKINKISHTTYDDALLDLIVRKMALLKSMIRDSLDKTFATRTYAENKEALARFVITYNELEVLLRNIHQARLDRADALAERNNKTTKRNKTPEFPTLFTRGYDVQ